jgi:hypothetical protein
MSGKHVATEIRGRQYVLDSNDIIEAHKNNVAHLTVIKNLVSRSVTMCGLLVSFIGAIFQEMSPFELHISH